MSDDKAATVKPVLIRFPPEMHARIQAHQERMSASMGGARVTFHQAALHLLQAGAEAHEPQSAE